MIRRSLGLIVASLVCAPACAGDMPPLGEPARAQIGGRCAALGEGFFAVAGSDACVRISGRISAGVDFAGAGKANFFGVRNGGIAPASAFSTETAVSGDMRFDTGAGPARLFLDVRKDTNSRWGADGQ
jgi:hypothetical protein